MIVNALIINSPISPNISLRSFFPPRVPQLQLSSTDDDDSDDHLPTENDGKTWHHQLAQSLISMYHDMHVIITGFDEISQNGDTNIQQQKIQLEMMRMVLMLNPSDLLTYNKKEPIFPYTDLRDTDNSSIEQESYQHEKLRMKIHRIISKLKRGMEKLRLVLFSSSYEKNSSDYVNNYRKRIEKSLLEIREQMMEYNHANQILETDKQEDDELTKHQKTIQQLIAQMTTKNPLIDQRIEDYKTKLEPKSHAFISSPLISVQSQAYQKLLKLEDDRFPVETLKFPDLNHEANEFFGRESSNTI